MVRNKLSDQDQMTLVRLYRKSSLTATVLADYYEVSPSTITRLLKEAIPEQEYQELVSQKRSLARRKDVPELGVEHVEDILQLLDEEADQATLPPEPIASPTDLTSAELPVTQEPDGDEADQDQSVTPAEPQSEISIGFTDEEDEDTEEDEDADQEWEEETDLSSSFDPEVLHDLEEEIEHSPQGEADEDLDEYGDEDYDDDDEDYDDDDEAETSQTAEQIFEILPLEDLEPPHQCYVVVDRFDELTTRPLRDFMPTDAVGSDAAQFSAELVSQAKTLPIFDNQRVARRFSQMSRRGSHPSQRNRVIQFPGYLLDIVRSQLQSKGITHLLVDGQVYSL